MFSDHLKLTLSSGFPVLDILHKMHKNANTVLLNWDCSK